MKFKLCKEESFTPVKIHMTFETEQELQEFELRMHLYGSDLEKVRPESFKKAGLNKTSNSHSIIKGISSLRDEIKKFLGHNSVIL